MSQVTLMTATRSWRTRAPMVCYIIVCYHRWDLAWKKKKCLTTISATSHLGVVQRETEEQNKETAEQRHQHWLSQERGTPRIKPLSNEPSVMYISIVPLSSGLKQTFSKKRYGSKALN